MIVTLFRGLPRRLLLVATLVQCLASFGVLALRRIGRRLTVRDRAAWMQRSCQLVMRRMSIRLRVNGPLPTGGLIVANHLSYLDIMLFGAAVPCVFVSKREIRSWPVVGMLASLGGTIFIDRSSSASTASVAAQMAALLAQNVAVLLFPEGTSSDGSAVQRFHPSLFEPAASGGLPVTAAAIGYALPGHAESDLCYYGDIHFASHLLQTLGRQGIAGTITFAPTCPAYPDRRTAAAETRAQIAAMRQPMCPGEAPGRLAPAPASPAASLGTASPVKSIQRHDA